MGWTLKAWHEVNARREHALRSLPDDEARLAFAWQTVASTAEPDSGLSAMEALAWALYCLACDLNAPRLGEDNVDMAMSLAAACLGLGFVEEFGHPLSFLHAELFEIKSRLAARQGQSFLAHWRSLQARQIRRHAGMAEGSNAAVATVTPITIARQPQTFEAPPRGANYPLENALWALATGRHPEASPRHPEGEARRTSSSSPPDADPTLTRFVHNLQRYQASTNPMGPAVDNVGAFLATVTERVPANVALLVWGAAARVFQDKALFDFAGLCQDVYRELSEGLSQGHSSDLLELKLCS